MATQTGQASVSPARERTLRPTKVGVVTSAKRKKTITVTVSFSIKHEKYSKYMRRRTVMQVHDEQNEAREGDRVEVVECRPLSKTKSWRLVRVVERAPLQHVVGSEG